MDSPLLIFGLGNPGEEYARTYHNAGFFVEQAVKDALLEKGFEAARKHERTFWYEKYGDLILAGAAERFFMNQSGTPVKEALSYFKLDPSHLVLLHDDSDLPLGEWKIEAGRGAAGHHGVESVIEALGTNEFLRGRIGIRPQEREEGSRRKAGDFVLKRIGEEDLALLASAAQGVARKLIEKV